MHRVATVSIAVFFAIVLTATSLSAATHFHKPVAHQGPQRAPSALVPFDCGTYKGNELESWAMGIRYKAKQARMQRLQVGTPQVPVSFVHEDVWVVEDDGSLLIQGNSPFDMNAQTIVFTPNGTGYNVTTAAFAWDFTYGPATVLGDDDAFNQALQFTFPFYGVNYSDVWVNSNGALSFTSVLNLSGFFNDADFFNVVPKIAGYYMDLDPSAAGFTYLKDEATKVTVTWLVVPEWGQAGGNSFQMVLFSSGVIQLTYNGIFATSQNNGLPIAVGVHPGGDPTLALIDYSNDLPFGGGAGNGIYEDYLVLANPRVDEVALTNAFYQNFTDDYFQIVFFTNWIQTMSGFANERNISNNIQGIGLGIFDNSLAWGSNGVLESRCNMNRLGVWQMDPTNRFFGSQNNFLTIMAQESGHRWGAFINFLDSGSQVSNMILGRADAHWSYFADVDHSGLEGGNWEYSSPTLYTTPTMIDYFGDVDEYTFGTRLPEEVSDFFYVSSAANDLPQNRSLGTPVQGAFAQGNPVTVTIGDVIAAEGPRVPAERPDKDLRQAFILLIRSGNVPTQQQLDKIVGFRTAWEPYFEVSVDGRLSLNTSITQTFNVAVIKGTVRDYTTTSLIDGFTATSVERGFDQHVPGGGRYTFRYMAPADTLTSESATIAFSADGYEPETIVVDIPYDTTHCVDVRLRPIVTGVPGTTPGVPAVATLHRSVPNPFNPSTTISYSLPVGTHVSLRIFDVHGRLVKTLVDRAVGAGNKNAQWDATDDGGATVGSGVYFVQFKAAGRTETQKVVLLK
jgi:hypothetical protein